MATGYEDSEVTLSLPTCSPFPAGTYQTLDLDTLELSAAASILVSRTSPSLHRSTRRSRPSGFAPRYKNRSACTCAATCRSAAHCPAVSTPARWRVAWRHLENGAGPKGLLNTFSAIFPGDSIDERPVRRPGLVAYPMRRHTMSRPNPNVSSRPRSTSCGSTTSRSARCRSMPAIRSPG